MKKFLLALLATTLATPTLAAQQPVAQLSSVTASREALRTAINTQLSAVQSNFDEVYAVINAGPVYVNTTAPADTKVVWIDTDQDNAIKVYVGGVWTVVGGGGSYTLPTAAADTLGGVKVGDRLTITDGVLSADVQTLGSAAYSDVVALWTTCTGYLKSDGTCDTPPGGVAEDTAYDVSTWDTDTDAASKNVLRDYFYIFDADGDGDFTDETWFPSTSGAPTNATYLTATAEAGLSAESNLGALTTGLLKLTVADGTATPSTAAAGTDYVAPSGNITGTAGGLSGTPNITVGTISAGAAGFGVGAAGDVTAKSVTITRTAMPSAIDLYEGTGEPGDNKLTLTLSGGLVADVMLYADQILAASDVDDAPVDGDTTAPVSSNWAYDHEAAADPHPGYVLESAIGTTVQGYDADLAAWAEISPTGGLNFGGATSFEVPNGASPTVNTTGQVAVDTTSDQLVFYGAAKRVISYQHHELFVVKSPVATDDFLIGPFPQAITLTGIKLVAQGGGSIAITPQICEDDSTTCSSLEAITADGGIDADDGTLTATAIEAGGFVKILSDAPTGTVDFLSGSIYYTITAD